jgi:tetratricopeptide (TPR) repeat protein
MDRNIMKLLVTIFWVVIFLIHPALSQNHIDSIIELGDDLISLNDYEAAEEHYEQALEIKSNYIPALEARIEVLLLMNRYNKAQKASEKALEKHVGHPTFHLYQGKALIGKERYADALVHLNNALELTDEDDTQLRNKIYVNKGAVLQKQNDFEQALENYSRALEINRTNPNVFIYRGNLYYKRENYDQALTDFQEVLELDPNNHVARYNLGMCYFKQGEKLSACDSFHKACEMGNKNACKMVISKCLRSIETQ